MKTSSPSFGERRAKLEAIADVLKTIASTLVIDAQFLADEVSRMRAAEARFAQKQPNTKKAPRNGRPLAT